MGKTMSLQEWCKYQIERRESMSDAPTPRTDEEYYKSCGSGHYGPTVPIDFARQLEQECDEARDRLAALLAFVLEDFQLGMTTRGYREAVENACALLGVSFENA